MRKKYSSGQITEAMEVLFEPVRIKIVSRIASMGTARAVDVADAFDLTQPTMSHHLNLLVEKEILKAVKEGRCVYYSVNPLLLNAASDMLISLSEGKSKPAAPVKKTVKMQAKQDKTEEKSSSKKSKSKNKSKGKDKEKTKDKKDKSKKKKKK
jgi:ArsR family transcriptional regulator